LEASRGSGAGVCTSDPLEEVLAPGYFEHAGGLLRPGELIYVSTRPGAAGQRSGQRRGAWLW
jgi:hypothetical protein